jgi:putative tryptophan/tyrosine transport system ATP-binding protein
MMRLEHITVSFGHKQIFHDLSCTIEQGDFIMIVGPNGAGKTTLFDLIAGHVRPTKGRMLLDDKDIVAHTELQRSTYLSRLFQNTYLNCAPLLTVAQNLALACYKGRRACLQAGMDAFPAHIVDDVIKPLNLGLEHRLHHPMGSLSGGQRQVISFIMATLVKPRILLLDEPTAALDPVSTTKLLTFAHRYIKEHALTTLMITHDPELARTLGSTLWVIEQGTISKKFHGIEKQQLLTHDMSGNIDYETIQRG